MWDLSVVFGKFSHFIADTLWLFHPYESNCGESFTFTLYTALLSIYKFKYCEHFLWQIKAMYSELKISPVEIPFYYIETKGYEIV